MDIGSTFLHLAPLKNSLQTLRNKFSTHLYNETYVYRWKTYLTTHLMC